MAHSVEFVERHIPCACCSSMSVSSLEHDLQEKLKGRADTRVFYNKGL